MYRYILCYKLSVWSGDLQIVTNIANSVIPMRKYKMAFKLLEWINFNCSQLTYADASFIGSFENFVCHHILYNVTICQQWLLKTFKRKPMLIFAVMQRNISHLQRPELFFS